MGAVNPASIKLPTQEELRPILETIAVDNLIPNEEPDFFKVHFGLD